MVQKFITCSPHVTDSPSSRRHTLVVLLSPVAQTPYKCELSVFMTFTSHLNHLLLLVKHLVLCNLTRKQNNITPTGEICLNFYGGD
jgi:hypothetical protein